MTPYEYPRHPDGDLHLGHVAAQVCHSIHPIGSALTDCASRLAYIKELLPQRGELVEEFRELVATLAWIEKAYRDADEHLVDVAHTVQHEERCRREGWTPIPMSNGSSASGDLPAPRRVSTP